MKLKEVLFLLCASAKSNQIIIFLSFCEALFDVQLLAKLNRLQKRDLTSKIDFFTILFQDSLSTTNLLLYFTIFCSNSSCSVNSAIQLLDCLQIFFIFIVLSADAKIF